MKEFRRLNTTNQKFPTVWAALSVAIKEKLWGMVEIVKKRRLLCNSRERKQIVIWQKQQ